MQERIANIKKMSFEEAYKELEKLISEMDKADASLDSSIENYEYGNELKKFLELKLQEAELKISKIKE